VGCHRLVGRLHRHTVCHTRFLRGGAAAGSTNSPAFGSGHASYTGSPHTVGPDTVGPDTGVSGAGDPDTGGPTTSGHDVCGPDGRSPGPGGSNSGGPGPSGPNGGSPGPDGSSSGNQSGWRYASRASPACAARLHCRLDRRQGGAGHDSELAGCDR
jgi:hypothetical protein